MIDLSAFFSEKLLYCSVVFQYYYHYYCHYYYCLTSDLRGETRLAPANKIFKKSENASIVVMNDEDYPLLTELFFLAHAAIRIGWTSLIARHFETGQQLHRLEDQLQPHESDNSNDSQGKLIYSTYLSDIGSCT